MSLLMYGLSGFLLITGSLFVLAGGIGALRMPDFYSRIHGASLTDSLGPVLVIGGLALQADSPLVALKLAAVLLFLLITSPTATYALANAALLSGLRPKAYGETSKPDGDTGEHS